MNWVNRGLQLVAVVAIAFLCWVGWGNTTESLALATAANRHMVSTIEVHLGTEADELKFVPDHLQFEAGKRYKLVLDNPSPEKHYFTAKDFADAIWTQKVEAGKVEVKGAVHELELKPGAIAEWVFIPQRPGTYGLRCTIAGHTEAGMTGTLVITE